MRSNDYPKIPSIGSQLATTVCIAIVLLVFIYFFNPDGQLSPEWKRYLTRSGAILNMMGCILGGYVWLYDESNTERRAVGEHTQQASLAEVRQVIESCSASIAATLRLKKLNRDIANAAVELDQAANFDKTAAKLEMFALRLFVLGTILQFWAA
jgi:hypothetical protein